MKQYTTFKKLFNETNFVDDNVSTNADGIVDNKYSALGKVITTGCWAFDNAVKQHNSYLSDQVQQLQKLRDNFNGSDVSNNALERKLDYIQNLEVTEDALRTVAKMFNDLHQELYSEEYRLPVKGSIKKKVTQATEDADALLNKYDKYIVTEVK